MKKPASKTPLIGGKSSAKPTKNKHAITSDIPNADEDGQFRNRLSLATSTIRLLNVLLILLQYSPPIDLLRRSYQSIRRSPFLMRKDHAVNDLDARKPTLSACVLEFLEDDGVELFALSKFLEVVAFDAVCSGELLEGGLGGDDDRDWFLFVFGGVAADICDDGGGAVD